MGSRAAQNDLHAAAGLADLADRRPDALVRMMRLAGDLLAAGEDGLAVAETHRGRAPFVPLNDTGHHLAELLVVFVVERVALCFADLLDDDLLGRLCDDPSHRLFGIEGDAVVGAADRAVATVDIQYDLLIFAILFFGGGDERSFDRLKDDLFLDIFVAVDRVDDPQHFAGVHLSVTQ